MKKILNFEINKKASKVNQQRKQKARSLAGKYYTHAHSTLKHARAVAERPRPRYQEEAARAPPDEITKPGGFRRNQPVHRSIKNRPVQPVFTSPIASMVF